ncbi:MAG TPA: cytochrome c biogenesis CcdA family protein [Gaiellaceae bacterium]|nr:cytochrome c biogenesis CcdA family protein [Gaiellaceae bacterium]
MIELGPGGLAVAFAAGVVAFTSPCVLPLVPGYLSFVSGVGFDELGARPRQVTVSTAAFVAGFTTMFVALGAGAAWFGDLLLANRRPLEIVAGAFLIVAAALLAGLPVPRLFALERRLPFVAGGGLVAAWLTGVAFAVGWTPCVGPTLGAILTLSAGGQSAGGGALLLATFSLGLGLPFLLFGLAFTRSLGLARRLRRHWRAVSLASAALLAVFGALLLTGDLVTLTARLARYTGWQI